MRAFGSSLLHTHIWSDIRSIAASDEPKDLLTLYPYPALPTLAASRGVRWAKTIRQEGALRSEVIKPERGVCLGWENKPVMPLPSGQTAIPRLRKRAPALERWLASWTSSWRFGHLVYIFAWSFDICTIVRHTLFQTCRPISLKTPGGSASIETVSRLCHRRS